MMNNSIFLKYVQEYTDVNLDKLKKLSDINYKNLWNFIVIQWNNCINNMEQSKYKTMDNVSFKNILGDYFYHLLLEFIEDENIMKIKFCTLCIDKYL